jgi:hypothetical protein
MGQPWPQNNYGCEWHLMMLATNPAQSNYFGIGLGGMIRRPPAWDLLKKLGNQL